MSHVILGTAGHIDHGKTTLIKAITGIDTDRLKEEKARGITIDLGFAHMALPSGRRIGIVDVPGHERFIKNMVAGAGGIDLVMLVIAADEGVMPQTREHLQILKLLQVHRGLTVLTKRDLVEEEWLELVTEEVRSYVRGTFLESAPIIPVSSTTGEGIPELIEAIDELCSDEISKDLETPFRLPVDRIFSLRGIGTVVTGSLLWGTVKVGDEVEIYPQGTKTRIKSIEVHDRTAEVAEAGQRVALNLSDFKVEDISRGDVVAKADSLLSVTGLYAYFQLLEGAPLPLKHRQRVRFHAGTKEALGRIYLLDRDKLHPGDEGFFYILLEEPVVCGYKDKFIVRSYSPVTTLGGGSVLFPNPRRLKKAARALGLETLEKAYRGGMEEGIAGLVSVFGPRYLDLRQIAKYMGKGQEQVKGAVDQLIDQKRLRALTVGADDIILDQAFFDVLTDKAKEILKVHHNKNPLTAGLGKEELRSRLDLESRIFEGFLATWIRDEVFEVQEHIIKQRGFEITLSPSQQSICNEILHLYEKASTTPPEVKEVLSQFPAKMQKEVNSVLVLLLRDAKLVKLSEGLYISATEIDRAKGLLRRHFSQKDEITVAEFRDLLGTTRKYALPLLEYLDRQKITQRFQDVRRVGNGLNP